MGHPPPNPLAHGPGDQGDDRDLVEPRLKLNIWHPKFDMRMEMLLLIPCEPSYVFISRLAHDLLWSDAYDNVRDVLRMIDDLVMCGLDIRFVGRIPLPGGRTTTQRAVQLSRSGCKAAEAVAAAYFDSVYS